MLALPAPALRELRGGVVSMIFQEPMTALDPVYTIGEQIAETVVQHEGVDRAHGATRARWSCSSWCASPRPQRRLDAYPHEMSGGMRQRAMIALALSCRPRLLLADEPTTALDATVQIQILLLLRQLQRELGMAMIFVTHDIGVAAEIADRIAVMYAGRIVETGTVRDVLMRAGASLHARPARLHRARRAPRHARSRRSPARRRASPPAAGLRLRAALHASPSRCLQGEIAAVVLAPERSARCVKLAAPAV